jgi:ribose transport system permease protein
MASSVTKGAPLLPEGGAAPVPDDDVVRDAGRRRPLVWIAQYGLIVAFVAMLVAFSLARPQAFPTWDNAIAIVSLAAPLLMLGIVVTIPMIIGDFDLSVTQVTQFAGALALYGMQNHGWSTPLAVVAAVAAGVAFGCLNGILVATTGISAFILTLAVGSVAMGAETAIAGDSLPGTDVPASYLTLARSEIGPIPVSVVIVAACGVALWFFTQHLVWGRSVRAIGGSMAAARLAGINVRATRVLGFVIVGLGAAVAGVLMTSQSGAYYAGAAGGLLLPAYTGVFIGATVGPSGQFNVPGSCFGIIFMATLTTGLTMIDTPAWTNNVISGVVLATAVLLTRLTRSGRTAHA